MKRKALVALCFLGAGAFTVSLQAQSTPRIQFEKYKLPNGLEVILHEDHSTPIVAVDTWYHVGSGDEQARTVVDASTCKPVRGAAVDIWHADAAGVYSGFGAGAAYPEQRRSDVPLHR